MQVQEPYIAPVSKVGMMGQKQQNYYVLRLKAVAGDLTASQLSCIAAVAEKYGRGFVHLSTRQGVEIHYVHRDNLEHAELELQQSGVELGSCGPRIRVIVACPGGETCRWGVFDTKKIARELDARYFKKETPSKFKMSVTGCANNCTKANENDIGVRGAIEPKWIPSACSDCGLCIPICPVNAIDRKQNNNGHFYVVDHEKCINCGVCKTFCADQAWAVGRRGYTLFIGGTMGRIPRFASILKKMVETEDELYLLIEKTVQVYKDNAQKKERFGHMINRIGLENVKEEIFGNS